MLNTKMLQGAFEMASGAHAKQKRKGTETPYIAHPMAVASLIIEAGGSDHVVAAAFLHDVIEDCGFDEAQIRTHFGDRVTELVLAVTNPSIKWKELKSQYEVDKVLTEYRLKYMEKLRGSEPDIQLLSVADKLHNARGILQDLRNARDDEGEGKHPEEVAKLTMEVWDRFRGKRKGTLWYYQELAKVYSESESAKVRTLGRHLCAITDEMARDF